MSQQTPVGKPIYSLLSKEVEGFDSLAELALDMRSSWNHWADEVQRELDPDLWEFTHNPWVVLQTVSRDRMERVSADPAFRKKVDALVQAKRQAAKAPAWFQQPTRISPDLCCVFQHGFMLERGSAHLLRGLGNVAGDQLKTTSDLGVPVIGVGLLYQQGYFRQVLDKDGARQALFPHKRFPGNCRSRLCAKPTGSGCGWSSTYLVTRSGCALGRSRLAECSFTCWTAMTSRTSRLTEALPASFTGVGRNCVSSKNCFSGLVDGGCSVRRR